MKRGNTALKRVVSVASVAAMAIAGAVLAAPAASAAPVTPTGIRATPAVDAPWITTPADYGNTYALDTTGEVPGLTIGQKGQVANGVQMLVAPGWAAAGDTITLTLDSGAAGKATFSQLPSSITLSKKAVDSTDDTHAGHGGTNASSLTAGTGVLSSNAVVGALDSTKTKLTITLPAPTESTPSAGTDAYLLSVDGVRVDVAADQPGTPGAANQTLVISDGTNDATIGYIDNLRLALNGNASSSGSTVNLPTVVVAEGAQDSFESGAAGSFTVTVTGTDADSTHELTLAKGANFKVQASGSVVTPAGGALSIVGTGATNNTVAVTYADSSDTKMETVAISGLVVTNVKPGTELTVAVTSDLGTATTGGWADASNQQSGAFATTTPGSSVPRIAGSNRYETAADVASAGASGWSGDAVVLANGENFKQGVDALSASFLAGAEKAPILLTTAKTLPAETKDALTALFKDSTANITLYVMGKTDSVSQDVRDAAVAAIKATAVGSIATVTVKEVAGDDRYATSVASLTTAGGSTSASYYDLGNGNLRTAFLASGQVNADALAASAVSAGSHIPVLLTTDGDALPKSVSDAITANGIGQIVILGSTDRVSQKVEDALTAAGVKVLRLAGTGSNGRYDTAVKIADLDRKAPTDGTGTATGSTVYIANGNLGWPDALSAGPLVAQGPDSLVTVGDTASLPVSTTLFLANNKGASGLTDVMALGGTDRVADAVVTQAQGLLK